MKNLTRKLVSVLLVFAIIFSIPTLAFAADKNETETPKLRGTVATMYICVSAANPPKPHCWIYLVNETDQALTVGHYTLPAHGALSMGCFKDRGAGNGIYYNLERYWVKEATYGRTFCMKTKVSAFELKKISATVNTHNYWFWLLNCSWFACSVWNCASPRQLLYLFAPQCLRVELLLWGARRPQITFSKCYDEGSVYKHTSDGLKHVSYSVCYTNTGV